LSALSRFLEPPRLRTIDDETESRRATWLELFFDLVFVVAVANLGSNLSDELNRQGFLEFLALFVPVWWAWMGFTFYANRFDTDDLPYRLLTLLGMFAVAALATTTRNAFDGGSEAFATAYVCVRLVLVVLYARARRHVAEARGLATLFLVAFGGAVLIWLASLLVEPPARYWLWALALAIELGAPFPAWRLLPRAPIHPAHIPERFGLLTIIVLGESVLAVVLGVSGVSWTLATGLAAAGGFLAAAALWWIYFEFLDESVLTGRGRIGGFVFTYAHYFVVVGLAALGVGVKAAILAAGGKHDYDGTGWLVCAGLAMTMLGLAAIHLATPPTLFDADVWLRLGTAGLAAVLLPFNEVIEPAVVLWLLAGALVVQVAVELARHEQHAPPPAKMPPPTQEARDGEADQL
jgi:low temperature requirement protein LtrA